MNLLRLNLSYVLCSCALILSIGLEANAQNVTWDGDAGNGNWSENTNWNPDTDISGGNLTLIFSGNVQNSTSNNLAANVSFNGLEFVNDGNTAATSANFTLSGNAITLSGDINTTAALSGTLNDTISLNLILDADRTINTGDFHNLTISGIISGGFGIVKTGNATLTLTGDNTYTGPTTLNAGTINVGTGGASGNLGTGDVRLNDGSLILNRTGGVKLNNNTISSDLNTGNPLIRAVTGVNEINLDNVVGNLTLSADLGANLNVVTNVGGTNIGFTNVTNSKSHIILDGAGDGEIHRTLASGQADGALTKNGTGTWTLFGVNTTGSGWSAVTVDPTISDGNININNGTLATGAANVLVWGGSGTGSKGDVVIQAPATLDIKGGVLNINGLSGAGTVDNSGNLTNTLTVGHENRTTTFSGNIINTGTGSLGLIKTGTGTLTLTGTNTYNGNTTVNNGQLIAGSANALGTTATSDLTVNGGTLTLSGNSFAFQSLASTGGTIENANATNATLTFGSSNTDTTFAGTLQDGAGGGTLSLVKNGTGTFTLSADTSHTSTTINSGKLAGEATHTGNLTLGSGTTLGIDASTAGNITVGTLDTSAGGVLVNIDTATNATGAINVASFTTWTGSTANLSLANAGNYRSATFGNTTSLITLDTGTETFLWSGATDNVWDIGGTNNWTSSDNKFYEGDTITFDDTGSNPSIVITGNNVNPSSITFANNATHYSISANSTETLNAVGGINITSNGNVTINTTIAGTTPITHSGNGTLQVGTGGTTGTLGSGDVALTGTTADLIFNRSDDLTYSGVLSGSGNITKEGAGTLTLDGLSTLSDASVMHINNGTVKQVGNAIASGRDRIIAAGATLEFNAPTTPSGTGTLVISGNGTVKKTGAGTVTPTSAGSTVAMGTSGLWWVAEGNYTFGAGSQGTWSSNLGDMLIDSGAFFETASSHVYVDELNGAGTLRIGGGFTVGQNNFDGGTATFSGTIGNDDFTGNGFNKIGSGTQILTGTNTYTGTTTISGGTLQIGNGGAIGTTGTGNVVNNANLIYNRTGAFTAANLTGSGNTSIIGGGTLTVTGTASSGNNFTIGSGSNLQGEFGTTGNMTYQGTTHTLDIDATTSAALGTNGSGVLDVSALNAGGFTINVNGTAADNITALTYGSFTGDISKFTLGSNTSGARGGSITNDTANNQIVVSLGYVNNTWTGATDSVWEIGGAKANWSNIADTVFQNSDTVIFDDTATSFTPTTSSDVTVESITFNNNTNAYTIGGGNVITVTNGITSTGSADSTINAAVGTQSITNSGTGTLTLAGGLSSTGIVFSGSGNTTISGPMTGSGGITMNGTGTTTISGLASVGGTRTAESGTLFLERSSFPTGSGSNRTYDTGDSGNGTIVFNITSNLSTSNSFGTITGNGTLRKAGGGTITFFSSGTTVSMGSGSLFSVDDGLFSFGGGTRGVWDNNLSDMHIESGAEFDGRSTDLNINALTGNGTLRIGADAGRTALTIGVDNGSGEFTGRIRNTTLGSSPSRNIEKVGTGTQTLSGNNDYTGDTTITAGRLNLSGTNTSSIIVGANGTLGGEGSTTGSLTLGSGSTIAIDPSTAGAFTTSAGVTSSANVTVSLEGFIPAGNITVFNYGSGTVTNTDFVLAPSNATYRSPTFTDDPGVALLLNFGNESTIFQGNGTNPTFWDINGESNWDTTDQKFFDADIVTFDDTGVTNAAGGTVVLQSNVEPTSVTFSNTAGNNYTISGNAGTETITAAGGINVSGGGNVTLNAIIAGNTGITHIGTGTLILQKANTTTGGISIASGSTLQTATTGALTSGTVANEGLIILRGGTHNTATITGNGSVTHNSGVSNLGGTHTFTGNLTVNGGSRLELQGNTNLSDSVTIVQTSNNLDLENGFDDTVGSVQQTGGNFRMGYTNNTTAGTAELTVLQDSNFSNIQIATSGTVNFADGVNGTIGSISQLGNFESVNINVGSGGFVNITGAINSGNGEGQFNTGGAGTVRVTNTTSAFGGGTRISNGVLEFNSINNRATTANPTNLDSSLGNAELEDVLKIGSDSNSATLRMIGTNSLNSSNRSVQLGDAGGTIEVVESAQTLTLSGTVSGDGTLGNGGLTTGGNGTLVLAGNNTYTGGTTVSSGTLLVNNTVGSGTGSGAVSIASGATLGGNGSIAGATTIGGGHSAGINTATGTVGSMNFADDLSYVSGASMVWDLIENSTSSGFDTFAVGGDLDFGTAGGENFTFNINLGGSVSYYDSIWSNLSTEWKVWDVTGVITGFDNSELTIVLNDSGIPGGPQNNTIFAFEARDNDGVYLTLTTAVPEPGTFTLMGLGLAGFGWFVRRRKRAMQATDEKA